MTILERILTAKREEIASAKQEYPLSRLKSLPLYARPLLSLSGKLQAASCGIIAEIKRESPSKGLFHKQLHAGELAHAYEEAGASGVSVLTDAPFFGGSLDDLEMARKQTDCPILRKDFIIDSYQLFQAKAFGADAVLLIAAALEGSLLEDLAREARHLGLEVLLEVHGIEELKRCPFESVDMLGVNNRDLTSFEVDVQRCVELAGSIPSGIVKVAESGISNISTIRMLQSHGYQGFLIGEAFMRAEDPAAACRDFISSLKELVK